MTQHFTSHSNKSSYQIQSNIPDIASWRSNCKQAKIIKQKHTTANIWCAANSTPIRFHSTDVSILFVVVMPLVYATANHRCPCMTLIQASTCHLSCYRIHAHTKPHRTYVASAFHLIVVLLNHRNAAQYKNCQTFRFVYDFISGWQTE